MAERGQKGCQNTSDDGVSEILQGFVLTPKIEEVLLTNVWAGHSRFNCTYIHVHVKAVGNKGVLDEKMSFRASCIRSWEINSLDSLSSELPSLLAFA